MNAPCYRNLIQHGASRKIKKILNGIICLVQMQHKSMNQTLTKKKKILHRKYVKNYVIN
jgi:hypothetical protein